MNSYGRQAMEHWRQWLPARYRLITDHQVFFSMLGQQAESQILELTEQLAGPDLPGEGYLEKVGRLNMAKNQAQEWVLREMILLDPEPEAESDDLDENPQDQFWRLQNRAVREVSNRGDVADDPDV